MSTQPSRTDRKPSRRFAPTASIRPGAMAPAPAVLFGLALILAGTLGIASADTRGVTFSDVTPRAFSAIWLSDVPVDTATLQVFADADGINEISADLDIQTLSADQAAAHAHGLVKVDVVGVEPDTRYYVRTRAQSLNSLPETVVHPAPGEPLLEVRTAVAVTLAQDTDPALPIANDLIYRQVTDPGGPDAPDGVLVLIRVPGLSPYPISAFVGDGAPSSTFIGDLNNLFGADGRSVQVPPGEPMEIVELRGGVCAPNHHGLTRIRRTGDETEPAITELREPAPCFVPSDFNCDGQVGPVDFNELLLRFGLRRIGASGAPECRFNSDYDLVEDDLIDPRDFNDFLLYYGMEEAG